MEQWPHDQFYRTNRRPSALKCFFHQQLSLDLARLWRPTRWTIVLFRAHTHIFMIRLLRRSYKRLLKHRERIFPTFLNTNRHEPFLSDCQIVPDPTRTNLFYGRMFMQYWIFWWKKCPRMSLSHGMSHDDLALSVNSLHRISLAQRLILEDFHGIRVWAS